MLERPLGLATTFTSGVHATTVRAPYDRLLPPQDGAPVGARGTSYGSRLVEQTIVRPGEWLFKSEPMDP